jgi:hypothetical protein
MLPRPRIRVPLALAAAIVTAIYVLRAALRGFDLRPDMPQDAVVLAAFLVLLSTVAYVRRRYVERTSDDVDEEASEVDSAVRSHSGEL